MYLYYCPTIEANTSLVVSYRSRGTRASVPERPHSALARTQGPSLMMPTSSGIRTRPASARPKSVVTYYSSKPGSSPSKSPTLTPSPPVATNRATMLRLNSVKAASSRDDWVLPETREYLERSQAKTLKKFKPDRGNSFFLLQLSLFDTYSR